MRLLPVTARTARTKAPQLGAIAARLHLAPAAAVIPGVVHEPPAAILGGAGPDASEAARPDEPRRRARELSRDVVERRDLARRPVQRALLEHQPRLHEPGAEVDGQGRQHGADGGFSCATAENSA